MRGYVREQDSEDVSQEAQLIGLERGVPVTRFIIIDAIRRLGDSRTPRPVMVPVTPASSVTTETPMDWMLAEESVREFLRRFPRGEPSPHWLRFEFARRKSLRAGMV